MRIFFRIRKTVRAFSYGCLLGVLMMLGGLYADKIGLIDGLTELVFAAGGFQDPNGNGGTNDGTAVTCDGGGANWECIDDADRNPAVPNDGGYLSQTRNQVDFFQMSNNINDVATVTAITVEVYHLENRNNYRLAVELFNAAETVTYGAGEVTLPYLGTAGWGQATFSGLTLSQTDLTGLRVRLRCLRPSGGGNSTCFTYGMYTDVTYDAQINVTVSTSSSQKAGLDVGTTSAHVGGMFVINENTGSRDITSITIEENGTVDALNDLDNIELYYETSGNCSLEGYDGDETQYGVTDTSGFSAANGTSVFTDTGITIDQSSTTASELCIYPVLDVLETASAFETLSIAINDPSTDVDGTGTPSIEPDFQLALSGTTTLLKTDLVQTRYHWREDNGDEGDTGSGADSATGGTQNDPFGTAAKQTNYRIRMEVDNTGNATSSATQYRLEYGTKATDCSAITAWTDVGAAAGDWHMGTTSVISDGNTTNITNTSKGALTDDGVDFVGTGALRESTSLSGSITLDPDEFVELEYAVYGIADIVDGTTYCFRATSTDYVLSYTEYPEITFQADLSVSAEQAQPAQLSIPTTTQLIGSFVIGSTSVGSRDIDEITITASTTGNLTDGFENIILRWEYDTTVPVDCVDQTFAGSETQYGVTDSNGFEASGTSTFTQGASPPQSNTTRSVCLYVTLDVTASSSDGDTLDIKIQNPSTDVVLSAGTAAPANEISLSGVTTLVAPLISQVAYHWRNNSGTELTAGSSAGDEDTPFTELPKNTVQRLRIGVSNSGGRTSGDYQYELQWAQRVTTCDALESGDWTDLNAADDEWNEVASQLADGSDTTDISTTTGGVTNVGTFYTPNNFGQEEGGITAAIDLPANNWLELEYSLIASTSVQEGASYCFRVTDNGTALDGYTTYAEASIKLGTDFAVYRNSSTITGTTLTLTEGPAGDYDLQFNDASRAFIRITNAHHTGGGPAAGSTGNHSPDAVMAYISNPANIATSVNLVRTSATNDTRVSWEIVEYTGSPGGENEIVVRGAGFVTYGTGAGDLSTSTPTISGISDDTAVVPFITGQGNPASSRFDFNTGLSTSAWNTGSDTATFTRGESGGIAAQVSYAIVEFTGSNWIIQRDENTSYASGGATELQTIGSAVNSLSRAFIHAQHRAGDSEDQHGDFGHEVWLSGLQQISYRIDGAAQTPSTHASVAWIIENTQSLGDTMQVQRDDTTFGTIPAGGGGLTTTNVTFDTEVDDFTTSSLFITSRNDGTGRTFPEPMVSAELISTTQFQLQVSDDGDANYYRYEVVEWPTAARKLVQNYYQFYVDDDNITPTDPWPAGVANMIENEPMEADDGPIASGETIRIRMSLNVTAAAMPAGVDSFRLQYGELFSTCDAVTEWRPLGDNSSTTALWRGAAATPVDGTTLPSTILGVSDVVATYEEENPTALTPNLAVVGEDVEFDWNIEDNGATDKTSYCFRMVEGDGAPLESYTRHPIIRTVGYGPEIGDWQWFDDEASITPTTPLDGAGTNTTPTNLARENIVKLRTVLTEKSGGEGTNIKFKVQYSEQANFSSGVYDVTSTSTCTASSTWCYADAAGIDNAQIPDAVIGGPTCNGGVGNGCGTHNEGSSSSTATFDHQALSDAEFEFTLQHRAARANAVYYFRLFNVVDNEVIVASSTYPSVQIEGASLTFTVDGLPASTVTENVTLDETTSSTSIQFTSVPINSEYEVAHRITVDTNATEGYQVLLMADQPLTNTYNSTIPDFVGTNAAPLGWTANCSGTCFGYHAGDDLLSGGSARFGAFDTYAALSTTTADEIMYSSVPTNESHDIVYKIQIDELQPAGDYEASITYIAVPVF